MGQSDSDEAFGNGAFRGLADPHAPGIPADYPRPQLFRKDYQLLDGEWILNGWPIRVPYPPEAPLSGFKGDAGETLHYRKDFTLPAAWRGKRILLHFGAVDQVAEVTLNGVFLGKHTGGYLGFSFDITKIARFDDEKGPAEDDSAGNVCFFSGQKMESHPEINTLAVKAIDKTDPVIPYGKQSTAPQGMWYTGISGIWKSVWIEAVPETYIEKIKLVPDLTGVDISLYLHRDRGQKATSISGKIAISGDGAEDKEGSLLSQSGSEEGNSIHDNEPVSFRATIVGEGIYPAGFPDELGSGETHEFFRDTGRVVPAEPVLWEPDNPHLYRLRIDWGEDTVYTYFGLRTIGMKVCGSRRRPTLNGKAVFLNGVLDQGYYPEGIFVPGSYLEYDRDILAMKELGFNMLRKHIKVEPEYYYTACDRHGMLVMQDMVQSGHYSFIWDTFLPYFQGDLRPDEHVLGPGQNRKTEKERRRIFTEHTKQTVVSLYNHPSIIAWTIFNEGWGQFESAKLYHMVKHVDPDRLIDSASGWMDRKVSDFDSRHQYFRNRLLKPKDDRPLIISECGGFGYDLSPEDREEAAQKQRLINIGVNDGHRWKGTVSVNKAGRKSLNIDVPETLQPLQEKIVEGEDRFDEKMAELGSKYDAAVDRRDLRENRAGIDVVEAIDLIRKQYSERSGREFQYGGGCKSSEELTKKIIQMYREMIFTATTAGLCGLVYTQLSDVENEVNGLYTYDRTVCKVDKAKMAALGKMLAAWYEADTE